MILEIWISVHLDIFVFLFKKNGNSCIKFKNFKIMFDWPECNRIRDEILYLITLLMIEYDKLFYHLCYHMFNQIWNRISGGIYYPPFFFYLFYVRYINHMVKYEIYIFHVSKKLLFLSKLYFFNIFILQSNFLLWLKKTKKIFIK